MLWVNGRQTGKVLDSLNAPHIYDIGESLRAGENTITIMVDNTDYPTNGGHMTSQDTQTNWNGITGEISVRIYEDVISTISGRFRIYIINPLRLNSV